MPFASFALAATAGQGRARGQRWGVRRGYLILLGLLGGGLLAAGWYAYDRGFTRKWRSFVASEFRKRGVELRVSKLTFEPFRGIMAKNIQIYDARDQRRVLAVIDEMRLVINWANLVQGKTFLDALDLTQATLSLPIDPENARGPKIDITGLSGRLFLPPQQVYLSRLEADLYGVHLTASGRLINPQKFRPGPTPDGLNPRAVGAVAAAIIEQLQALKFAGQPAKVTVHFSGDFAAPEKMFGDITIVAERVRWRGLAMEKIEVGGTYREGRFELRELLVGDGSGTLQLSGQYHFAEATGALSVRSNLDLAPWIAMFVRAREVQGMKLHGAPTVELTGRVELGREPELHLLGHVSVPRFSYRAVEFDGLTADFSSDGKRWSARDLRVAHPSGEITGDILHLPGDVRVELKSTIEPEVLRPVLSGPAGQWLEKADG